MDREKDWISPADLPFDPHGLEKEYGSVEQVEIKCPGIYYLRVAPPADRLTNVWLPHLICHSLRWQQTLRMSR